MPSAEVVITMLPNGRIVREVADALAPLMNRSALFIDMSTIAPEETDAVAKLLGDRSLPMIDAPVARSSKEPDW